MSLHTWRCQGPCKPSSFSTFTLNSHWGRAATGKKKFLCLCVQGHVGPLQLFATLWTVACQAYLSGRGVSRQEYWSVLASTGRHPLLERCISCRLSHQLPWVPGAARTPATQSRCTTYPPGPHRGKPKPSRAASGANPRDWGVEVEIKPQLKPRRSVAKEEDPKPYHQLYKLQIKSTHQLSSLCLWDITRPLRAPTKENALTLIAADTAGKNTQE